MIENACTVAPQPVGVPQRLAVSKHPLTSLQLVKGGA